MTRKLAWIAAGGLCIGIACLVLAFFAGGRGGGFVPALTGQPCDMHADSAITERHLEWPGGNTVEIAVPAMVRYRAGAGSDVVVRGPAHFLERVTMRGHAIVLACHPIGSPPNIEITLPGEAFHRIDLSGSVRLVMESLDQPELALNIAGSGNVQMQGRLEQLTLSVAGSGQARVADLDLQRLIAKLSGSGHVEASPRESATIEIAGSADVRLMIRPKTLHSRIAGSGRVSQPPPDSAEKK